jgi:hypothetical protein
MSESRESHPPGTDPCAPYSFTGRAAADPPANRPLDE